MGKIADVSEPASELERLIAKLVVLLSSSGSRRAARDSAVVRLPWPARPR